ncbi:TonB C-terminal domain-containing protein [Acidithiobacillus sp. AMEEHan]|uniref:energy transducer TonB n=1 Tax=Acidithiobacillus sp. AMEEHan TaxID=2994951 RepID=UPI0027E4EF31|nr:energy transducer TonB [Acidithiobacillus sp. AMEEHan]
MLSFWLRVLLIRTILYLARVLVPKAEDLDQLFPWLLAATAVIGSLLLLFWVALLPEQQANQNAQRAHDSRVEITLTPLPQHNQFHPASDIPSLAQGPGLPSSQERAETPPMALKQRELADYLLLWQKHIVDMAKAQLTQQKLPTGKIVVAVTISPSGELLRIEVVQGEQNQILAEAVREILISAAPFPPCPPPGNSHHRICASSEPGIFSNAAAPQPTPWPPGPSD